nr:polysaccharide pyruvyl transferase family protein [uncultured Marvinbryantia sp.]
MRIGILTFSNAYNLGAALQAYSLQRMLEDMGNDAELIDYRCSAIDAMHKMRPVFHLKIGMKPRIYNLIYNIVFLPRRLRYICFRRYSKRSKAYSKETIKGSNGKYDVFITGSDQVFNLKLTGNDTTFFLDFVEKGKKTSYAASMGTYQIEKRDDCLAYLNSFDFLSVREKSAADLLKSELDISVEVMPDPVFLHTGEEWKRLLGIKERKRKKYVLVYALIEDERLYEVAKKIAKEYSMEVAVITKALRPLGKADRIIRNAGPREFVRLMANADYVVTNSFHGTAFSLVFEKQFYVLLPPAAPDRIMNLLNTIGLKSRIYTGSISCEIIDYSKKKCCISSLKHCGEEYLRRVTD